MILLDTPIGVWWVHGDLKLSKPYANVLQEYETQGLGVSVISCWEIAKLVEYQRLKLPCPLAQWLKQALAYPGIRLINLTPSIAIESTQLPGPFHRDPADQIIVATARLEDCPLITSDTKIHAYPYVRKLP